MKTIFRYTCIIFSCSILCSCPASYVSSYKMVGNEVNNDFYELQLKEGITFVRLRAIRQYTNDKKTFLVFNFKEPYNQKLTIISKTFGELKNELNDKQYYSVEINNIKDVKKDTVSPNISDKTYKFYHE